MHFAYQCGVLALNRLPLGEGGESGHHDLLGTLLD